MQLRKERLDVGERASVKRKYNGMAVSQPYSTLLPLTAEAGPSASVRRWLWLRRASMPMRAAALKTRSLAGMVLIIIFFHRCARECDLCSTRVRHWRQAGSLSHKAYL